MPTHRLTETDQHTHACVGCVICIRGQAEESTYHVLHSCLPMWTVFDSPYVLDTSNDEVGEGDLHKGVPQKPGAWDPAAI